MNPGKRVSPCSYLSQLVLYIPILLFSLATLVGCTAINIKDSVPDGSSKGYVEFYYYKDEGAVGSSVRIFSFYNDKRVFEGETGKDIGYKTGLRIAKSPGTYKFALCVGSAERIVDVTIKEGKITPVKMRFRIIKKFSNDSVTKISFDLNVIVEEAGPIITSEVTPFQRPRMEILSQSIS